MISNQSMHRLGVALAVTGGLAGSAGLAVGQSVDPAYAVQGGVATGAPEDTFVKLAPQQLDTLLGAIALYPDPLIAQILPASTYPIDIVRAARLVRGGATSEQIDQQSWDPSVKAVAHYPSVIEMMDNSIDWTEQLGQAFIAQPDEVMESIQRLRLQAQSMGNLVSTPQAEVLVEESAVRIIPATPEVIYVPVYQPEYVYYQAPTYVGSYISFGFGLPCGLWLDLDFDWHNRWCYRPGWTWNHWRDNIFIEHNRILHVRHDFDGPRGQRPPTVWHRDPGRPYTFPGHRMTNPSRFDGFRGREPGAHTRPTVIPTPRPIGADRGRWPERDRPTGVVDPRRTGTQTQHSSDRGQFGHGGTPPGAGGRGGAGAGAGQPQRPIRAPAPNPPSSQPSRPAPGQAGSGQGGPGQGGAGRPAPSQSPTRPAQQAPARVTPPPVHVAPPPAAATRPSPPKYQGSPATQRGDKSRGNR